MFKPGPDFLFEIIEVEIMRIDCVKIMTEYEESVIFFSNFLLASLDDMFLSKIVSTPKGKTSLHESNIHSFKARFHVDDLFLGDFNCSGDCAKLPIKLLLKSFSRSKNLYDSTKPRFC